jgi:hypothetical protein
MASTDSIPSQLLAAIKGRKFTTLGRLFASPTDFQAWTPTGRWVAEDGATVAKIVEVWFTPGVGNSIVWSNETTAAKGLATLEYEVAWTAPPDDQPRVLRETWILQIKGDKIASARVYCAGLHTEFPEVDLEKQRRSKGLGAPKPPSSPKVITARAS